MATTFDDHLANQLLAQRIIFLGSELTDATAQRVCSQLLVLSAEDPHEDIHLYLHSAGGSATAGLAVYDTMRLIPNDIATVAVGHASGMGQLLLTVGTPGKRYALRHARIALRKAEPEAGIEPEAEAGIDVGTEVDADAEERRTVGRLLARLTADRTGRSPEAVEHDIDRGRWFSAAQAEDYGLVDEVVDALADLRHPSARRRIGL
jgi:ATP-dependent Clp protease protease subunit